MKRSLKKINVFFWGGIIVEAVPGSTRSNAFSGELTPSELKTLPYTTKMFQEILSQKRVSSRKGVKTPPNPSPLLTMPTPPLGTRGVGERGGNLGEFGLCHPIDERTTRTYSGGGGGGGGCRGGVSVVLAIQLEPRCWGNRGAVAQQLLPKTTVVGARTMRTICT